MEHINFLMVFLEGLISFFSPCILPILPIYFSYLSGKASTKDEQGNVIYQQSKVFFFTLFFVLGICVSFFILGFSFTLFGQVLSKGREIFSLICGILIVFFGLSQLGIFQFQFLAKEKKIQTKAPKQITFLSAFLLGFTFSFAWTPCVGPILSSVLLLVADASQVQGYLYLFGYAIGFLVPFLIMGLFTGACLTFLKKQQKIVQYSIRIAGILLLIIGFSMIVQNTKSLFFSTEQMEHSEIFSTAFSDQFDHNIRLEDFYGKRIVLGFFDRYCSGCQEEMPLFEELYKKFQSSDIQFVGVMKKNTSDTKGELQDYLLEKGYSYSILIDEQDLLNRYFETTSFPYLLFIDSNGNVQKSILGAISKKEILNQLDLMR